MSSWCTTSASSYIPSRATWTQHFSMEMLLHWIPLDNGPADSPWRDVHTHSVQVAVSLSRLDDKAVTKNTASRLWNTFDHQHARLQFLTWSYAPQPHLDVPKELRMYFTAPNLVGPTYACAFEFAVSHGCLVFCTLCNERRHQDINKGIIVTTA